MTIVTLCILMLILLLHWMEILASDSHMSFAHMHKIKSPKTPFPNQLKKKKFFIFYLLSIVRSSDSTIAAPPPG